MGKERYLPAQYELVPFDTLPITEFDVHVYPSARPWNRKRHIVTGRRKCWCGPSRIKQQPNVILHVDRED